MTDSVIAGKRSNEAIPLILCYKTIDNGYEVNISKLLVDNNKSNLCID